MSFIGGGGGGGSKAPSGYNLTKSQTYTPGQMNLFNQGLGNVGPNSYLGRLAAGDQDTFAATEAPAMQQFSQLQGQMASRFSGQGLGGRNSSGFQNAGNQASQDFAGQLQSRRQALQMEAIRGLHGMSQDLLGNRPYETYLTPKKPSTFSQFASPILTGVGGALGGGLGAAAGSAAGNWASRNFSGGATSSPYDVQGQSYSSPAFQQYGNSQGRN